MASSPLSGGQATATARLRATVDAIEPFDDLEATHQADVLAWIDSDAPLYRTARPATPPKHLVAYSVVTDPDDRSVFLIDHRRAGLWLPAGGHVDVDEAPESAAARELHEELGLDAPFLGAPSLGGTDPAPLLVTVTRTVPGTRQDLDGTSPDVPHIDVSLWYVFAVERSRAGPMAGADQVEFVDGRWWAFDEIVHRPETRFDPHLPRFTAKLAALV